MRLLLPLLSLLALPARAAESGAGESGAAEPVVDGSLVDEDGGAAPTRELPEPEHGVSARLLFGGVSVPDEGDFPLVGVGVAYERDFFENLIAVEFALEGLVSPVAQAVLCEVVIEKPIEVKDGVGVYLGGGPTIALHIVDGKPVPGAGGLALFGVEAVVTGGLEVFVELDAAILLFDQPVLEADVGTGVLYRF